MEIRKIGSGAKWEDKVGYSRIVLAGAQIEIAGTTAIDENNNLIGENDAYLQAKYIIQKIEKLLIESGLSLKNITRTRIYVTNIKDWEQVGKAHGEFFGQIKPASTMLEVSSLINEKMLVEIEMSGSKF